MRSLPILACALAAVPAACQPVPGLIDRARAIAINYSQGLPDFVCTEVVRRYVGGQKNWRLLDTLVLKLDYTGHRENYTLVSVDGQRDIREYKDVHGTISTGEFGTLLGRVFSAEGQAAFTWRRRVRHRESDVEVYSYVLAAANARHELAYRDRPGEPSVVSVGDHGDVYIDPQSGNVVRIESEADGIPRNFPIRYSHTVLEYDTASIGGVPYLLPASAQVEVRTRRERSRNDVEFIQYRKFGADTTITFHEGGVQ
jgi:hypothetical protein